MADVPKASYDRVTTDDRISILFPQVTAAVWGYSAVIYFQAGARQLYRQLMEQACGEAGVPLYAFGSGFMSGINDLQAVVAQARADN